MKGRQIIYSAAEMAWLEANRLLVISAYHSGFCEAFERQDVSLVNLHSLRKRKDWKTGRTGCFEKGDEPVNKGVKCKPGQGGNHPNARKAHFKKGGRTGKAQLNYQPIGTMRLSQDGYFERKIHDGMPLQSRWRLEHLVRWEAINGQVPAGHCLKALDADRTNVDPANWELIPRALLPRLNGGRHKKHLAYDEASPEVRPAVMALAKLQHGAQTLRSRPAPAPASNPGLPPC